MANANSSASSAIEIVECVTPAQKREFIDFQWEIYKDDPCWVPPLISDRVSFYDKKKNPFFEHSDAAIFAAKRDGRVVGTIVAIQNNRHNETHNEKTGFFGAFEVINDQAVANALFDAAKAWVKARGMDLLRGPYTLSVYDEVGLLVDGFDIEPQPLMTHTARYYPALVEGYGFKKARDLNAWWADTEHTKEVLAGRFKRVVDAALKRGRFTVRNIDFGKLDAEVDALKKIFWAAWEKNWGDVPMTDHEIEHALKQLKQFADPELIFICEVAGKPVSFCLSLPNVNRPLRMAYPSPKTPEIWTLIKFLWYKRTQVNSLRITLMGTLPEYRGSGMDAVMIYKTMEAAIRKNYIGAECGWVLDNNEAMNRLQVLGDTKIHKVYRVYDLPI